MKKIMRIIAALMVAVFCFPMTSFASTGDPNIDNGGGGLGEGTEENGWWSGNDGVRVTIIDAETGAVKSRSVDYSNVNCDDIQVHFGKVSKAEYRSGRALSPTTERYNYVKPAQRLPVIVSDGEYLNADINEIRNYFTDEQVVRSISGDVGIPFDKLINGDYKMMLEPMVYVTYGGVRTALTATEAALYNQATCGDFKGKFAPLSHKNLPLAMFLEESESVLGYAAWTGPTDARVTDADILKYLGVGIISFREKPENIDVSGSDYEYRVDTDVYTSVTVSGGKHTPDNPVTVVFTIKNRKYTVDNVVFPEGDSQLVWVKWHTPNTEQTVNIYVDIYGGASASKTSIKAKIVDLNKNPPPDPQADDRNDGFRAPSVPSKAQCLSNSWSVWYCYWVPNWVWHSDWRWESKIEIVDGEPVDNGKWVDYGEWVDEGWWEFDSNYYSVSMSASMSIAPDEKNPTAVGKTMKSGYGINETVTTSVSGNGEHTAVQNAVAYFPEFNYGKYWRLLEGAGTLQFRRNKYSTYNNRVHFTPVWYPNGAYTVYTWVIDCWTPAGMLSKNCTDSVTINGNVFDDWHIAPTY